MRARSGFALVVLVALLAPPLRARDDEKKAAPAAPLIEVKPTYLEFRQEGTGGMVLTRYVIDEKAAKPYFYPVYALPTKPVTRAWPMEKDPEVKKTDHPHQKSLWFCHGDVIPEGLDYTKHSRGVAGIDFWAEGKGHGKIVCVKVEKPKLELTHAAVETRNEWRTAEGQKVLDETRTIHYYPFAPGANLLVLDIDLHASVCPITFADTKEGSLGVRVRESMRVDRGKGQLTNAEGKTGEGRLGNVEKKGCWGLVSAWCDYSGPVDDKDVAGIALFADPKNPIDTAWHARNYGLMAANPFGRAKHAGFPDRKGNDTPVRLAKGEHLKLRYGVFLHSGDVKTGKVADYYERFVKLGK
jgi:hypothetical protein